MALIVRIRRYHPSERNLHHIRCSVGSCTGRGTNCTCRGFFTEGLRWADSCVSSSSSGIGPEFIPNAYILVSDLRGFTRFTEAEPVVAVEHVLNTLDALTYGVVHEFEGTVRYSVGDSYCLTFSGASLLVAAAERLYAGWEVASHEGKFDCAINIALHRGRICAFRSFLYGEGIMVAARVQDASVEVLADRRGGVFVTSAVRDDLAGTQWQSRLQPVAVKPRDTRLSGMEICRLSDMPFAEPRRSQHRAARDAKTVLEITASPNAVAPRHRAAATSRFRFPHSLQPMGSGTGKPIKIRDRNTIKERDRSSRWDCPRIRQWRDRGYNRDMLERYLHWAKADPLDALPEAPAVGA